MSSFTICMTQTDLVTESDGKVSPTLPDQEKCSVVQSWERNRRKTGENGLRPSTRNSYGRYFGSQDPSLRHGSCP